MPAGGEEGSMQQSMNRQERGATAARQALFLTCVAAAIGLYHPDIASAAKAVKGAAAARPAAARPFAARPAAPVGAHSFGAPHAAQPTQAHELGHPTVAATGQPHPSGAAPGQSHPSGTALSHGPGSTPGQHALGQTHGPAAGLERGRGPEHNPAAMARPGGIARNGLPYRPFPGETGFTGVPPRGETRFVSSEMIIHVGADVSPQTLDAAARRLGLTSIASQNLSFSGGRLVHFRIADGQQVADAVRALEAEKIGIAQPNYVFRLQQDVQLAAPKGDPSPSGGDPAQYVVGKLHLPDAHGIASGTNVLVAVIDSLVDATHPDIVGSLAGQFDAVTVADKPDEHGTGMTGAIVAHRRLLGVAPGARVLAIHAFSPNAQHPQQATTQNIIAGIDWAIEKGARIINMSFAGPYDPMLQLALKKAHDKGVVLIAAAGNMGPQSPPLFPAADENVIAVTAVDENDKLLPQANQGPHIALAAPGVNVLEAAPHGAYNFTTGTSVAAAHVSGVAALILERNPTIDLPTLEDALFSTAKDLGTPGRDSLFGYGLVDPYRALNALEAKVAVGRALPSTTAAAPSNAKPITVATTSDRLPLGAATLVSGAPAAPIGPAVTASAPNAAPKPATGPAPLPLPRPASQAASNSGGALPPGPGKLTVSQLAPPVAVAPSPVALAPTRPELDDTATIERKRQACRQDASTKGVRGADLSDYVTVCVSEARLACLKQAVAQKVRGPERRDFMNRCLRGS
jgi:subtilisin family serine protease